MTSCEDLIDVPDPKMVGKKTMAILFQQQLLMHSHFVFWLNSYHVTARNTAKNVAPAIQIGKIAPTCVDAASSVKAKTMHYPPRTVLEEDLQLQEELC